MEGGILSSGEWGKTAGGAIGTPMGKEGNDGTETLANGKNETSTNKLQGVVQIRQEHQNKRTEPWKLTPHETQQKGSGENRVEKASRLRGLRERKSLTQDVTKQRNLCKIRGERGKRANDCGMEGAGGKEGGVQRVGGLTPRKYGRTSRSSTTGFGKGKWRPAGPVATA